MPFHLLTKCSEILLWDGLLFVSEGAILEKTEHGKRSALKEDEHFDPQNEDISDQNANFKAL